MKLEIENTSYGMESREIFKRIKSVTDLEVAADRASRMLSRFQGDFKIYSGGSHIALLSKSIFRNEYKRVAIFTV